MSQSNTTPGREPFSRTSQRAQKQRGKQQHFKPQQPFRAKSGRVKLLNEVSDPPTHVPADVEVQFDAVRIDHEELAWRREQTIAAARQTGGAVGRIEPRFRQEPEAERRSVAGSAKSRREVHPEPKAEQHQTRRPGNAGRARRSKGDGHHQQREDWGRAR
jgi:hypothetical protein